VNTQLVNSIIQVVRSLPRDEQQLLIESLNRLLLQPLTDESGTSEPAATADTISDKDSEEPIDADAWAVWQSLGDSAVSGQLDNPSVNHDRYLYAKPSWIGRLSILLAPVLGVDSNFDTFSQVLGQGFPKLVLQRLRRGLGGKYCPGPQVK
jgi:hypothetical protein